MVLVDIRRDAECVSMPFAQPDIGRHAGSRVLIILEQYVITAVSQRPTNGWCVGSGDHAAEAGLHRSWLQQR